MSFVLCKIIMTPMSDDGFKHEGEVSLDVSEKSLEEIQKGMNKQASKNEEPFTVELIKINNQ